MRWVGRLRAPGLSGTGGTRGARGTACQPYGWRRAARRRNPGEGRSSVARAPASERRARVQETCREETVKPNPTRCWHRRDAVPPPATRVRRTRRVRCAFLRAPGYRDAPTPTARSILRAPNRVHGDGEAEHSCMLDITRKILASVIGDDARALFLCERRQTLKLGTPSAAPSRQAQPAEGRRDPEEAPSR